MRASLFCVAILGLCLSVAVHVATFCGIDPQQVFPAVWMLHVGIFAIWFPAILFTNRRIGSLPRREQGAARMRGTPRMMRAVLGPLFAYTAFNFFFTIFVLQGGHSPTIRDSTFALQDSGRIVRALTEREYHRYRAYEVRTFSGPWILFYFAGMAMLYPRAADHEKMACETTVSA